MIPSFFGHLASGYAGLIDFVDLEVGISGWVLNVDDPSEPVTWSLNLGDQQLATGVADEVRDDISLALGRTTRCTLRFHWSNFSSKAWRAISSAPGETELAIIVDETGEEIGWASARPTASWLAQTIRLRAEARGEARQLGPSRTAPQLAEESIAFHTEALTEMPIIAGKDTAGNRRDDTGAEEPKADHHAAPPPMPDPVQPVFADPAPCVITSADEHALQSGLAVDRVVVSGGAMVVTGWLIRGGAIEFRDLAGAPIEPSVIAFYERGDVAVAYQIPNEQVRGFVAIWPAVPGTGAFAASIHTPGTMTLAVQIPSTSTADEMLQVVGDNAHRLGLFVRTLFAQPEWMAALLPLIPEPPTFFGGARGFIEHAKGISGVGGLAIGWVMSVPPCETMVVAGSGLACRLDAAMRWNRDDVVQGFEPEFGAFAFDAGFLVGLHGKLGIYDKVSLVATEGDSAYIIARSDWSPATSEPTSFARWAFGFPLPSENFGTQLARHISPIIDELIRRKNIGLGAIAPMVHDFGTQTEAPICSIVVPLYGRHDFVQQQLLEFADDPFIRDKTEILYVVDDPRIRGEVLNAAAVYSEVYGVPFRVVDGRVNRGFSGANNLGAGLARAPTLLFLNSDVFPTEPGWLQKMLKPLGKDPRVSMVGARLSFCNGSVQHDGMMFEWDAGIAAYLNKHPGAGFEAPAALPTPSNRIAVTGACMLMEAELYREVGGFDDGFLIGDFEDSDLCLKVRRAGRRIVCVEDVSLVHLERQSFSGLGTGTFRQRIVYYNLHRHQTAWGATIEGLMAEPQLGRAR